MVAVALVVIVSEYPYWWVAIPCAAVISREIVVSALREWMAELGKRATVKVSNFGKIKTACQMIAIFIIIFVTPSHKSQPHFDVWSIIGFILLYAAVILTVYSMWNYLVAAYYTVQQDKKEQL
jgi:CDP-diacylglycerol--glycerol-3-phosphate 3-phosphatidyltransferase